MAFRRTGYSKMYMIPPSVWELVKKCVDELEQQKLEQLNAEKSAQVIKTRGDQILSQVSAQDIIPLDSSYRSRSDIIGNDLSQPSFMQGVDDEFYITDPSIETAEMSTASTIPLDSENTVPPNRPLGYTRSNSAPTFERFDSPLQNIRSRSVSYKEPLRATERFQKNLLKRSISTVSPPENMPVDYLNRTVNEPFQPNITSTPIPKRRLYTIPEDQINESFQSKIPIPVRQMSAFPERATPFPIQPLPLQSCGPPKILITPATPARPPNPTINVIPATPMRKPRSRLPIRSPIQTRSRVSVEDLYMPPTNNKCSYCDKEFTKRSNLDRHLRVLHNVGSKFSKWKF